MSENSPLETARNEVERFSSLVEKAEISPDIRVRLQGTIEDLAGVLEAALREEQRPQEPLQRLAEGQHLTESELVALNVK